jgi:hypothetical protein
MGDLSLQSFFQNGKGNASIKNVDGCVCCVGEVRFMKQVMARLPYIKVYLLKTYVYRIGNKMFST